MMCITIRGAHKDYGNDVWLGRRYVEILGCHHDSNKINILFALYLENKLCDGKKNFLHIMHPGNVRFQLYDSWPIPCHPDEPRAQGGSSRSRNNILQSVYGKAFEYTEGQLFQTNGLSVWDSWYGFDHEAITVWPPQEGNVEKQHFIKRVYPKNRPTAFVPFTVFELGPFTKKGPVVISFRLSINEKSTYEKLISNNRAFTIDGPESLLLRIKRDYIRLLPEGIQDEWKIEADKFEHYVGFGESYDVILIKPPYADAMKCIWRNGIVKAPIQPIPSSLAARYITAYPRFALCGHLLPSQSRKESKKIVEAIPNT